MTATKHHDAATLRALWTLIWVVLAGIGLFLAYMYLDLAAVGQWGPAFCALVAFSAAVWVVFQLRLNPWLRHLLRRGVVVVGCVVMLILLFALRLDRVGEETSLEPVGGNDVLNLRQVGQAMMQHQADSADYFFDRNQSAHSLALLLPARPKAKADRPAVAPEAASPVGRIVIARDDGSPDRSAPEFVYARQPSRSTSRLDVAARPLASTRANERYRIYP